MLRKQIKRPKISDDKGKRNKKAKREALDPSVKPLGSKKDKLRSEKELESLVLGAEDDIIKELKSFSKKTESDVGSKTRKIKHDKEKKPAWQDDDDEIGSVQLTKDRKYTGIKHGEEKKITKSEYSERLKSQFEKVSSTPHWATLPSERVKNSDDEDSDVEDIVTRTGTYLTSSQSLPRGILQVKQCTDINKQAPLKSRVKAVEFHPSAQVAMVGGVNNTINLFQVDGKTNPKIQSIYMESFPVHCAHFTRDGEQVIIGSNHKSLKYFDMMAGKIVNVPMKGIDETCLSRFEVSPDGKYLVFMGTHGRMHFLSAKAKEWLFTLTMNTSVSSISFTSDGRHMFSHGGEGQVYVWDLASRDCIHRFIDEGCTQGTSIAVSPNNQYIACGQYSGVVNLYDKDTCLQSNAPRPLKAIMNLTSRCTHTTFNPTSEILAIASREEERAVKLVHIPSQSVFSNFPDRMDHNLRIPTCIDWSVNSGYMAIGTHKGSALLYRLKHYGNY